VIVKKERSIKMRDMTINKGLLDYIDGWLKENHSPEAVLGENGLLAELTRAVVQRALEAELTTHLGYEKHAPEGRNGGNSRNGRSKKTLKSKSGEIPLEAPRDRNSSFEPIIVRKGQTRFDGFDEKIISLYARGLSTREIKQHLGEIYRVEVSPQLISNVTEAVMEEVRAWQNRPLDAIYPILYMDALVVKIRDGGSVKNKAVHFAVGVTLEGNKEVLGFWIEQTEGAKFWLSVMTELKNRGVQDVLIACVDGLKGFAEAIETVFPKTQVQLCMVHMVRNSLSYAGWKERKAVAADLREIYSSPTQEEAGRQLDLFEEKWGARFPHIIRSWRANWERLAAFMAYPQEIRKIISRPFRTNAIESLNSSLRKATKTRGSFPTDEAAAKLICLALQNITKKWSLPVRDWRAALNRFAIMFEDRMPVR
jgi:putative transposase